MHIHEFQDMMRQLYFHRDTQRGPVGTYNWLTDEVEELGQALKSNDRVELEGEFADVIAWLASLANLAGVDLERAAIQKYPDRCLKCGYSPCRCTS